MCTLCQSLTPTAAHDLHGLTGTMDSSGSSSGGESASLPTFTLDQVAYQLTHGYWASSNRGPRAFDVSGDREISYNLTGLDATGQAAARKALDAWTAASGLTFIETTVSADLMFDDGDSGAYAYSYLSGGTITQSFINIDTGWQSYGDYYHQTYIHEIGHALGLGHAGNYNGSADFETQAHYANDSWQMSIMSYFAQWENPNTDATGNYLATTMMADILAIQNLYGTPANANAGDTIYGDGTTLGTVGMDLSRSWSVTIFDSNGTDTVDLGTRGHAQRLDLRQESFSNINGEIGNFAIARGAVIENAVTGSGADHVTGNDAGNAISTGGGADTIVGSAGDDTLNGGAGDDLLVYDLPAAFAAFGNDGGLTLTLGDHGTDRLSGIETVRFAGGDTATVAEGALETTVHLVSAQTGRTIVNATLDIANSLTWASMMDCFDDLGRLAERQMTMDDGRSLTTSFESGSRVSVTAADLADCTGWQSYVDNFDAAGARSSRLMTLDDGRTILTTYSDGQREAVTLTDIPDLFAWRTMTDSYDAAERLVARSLETDDGRIVDTFFAGGQRTAVTVTDGADDYVWTSFTDAYSGAERVARTMQMDDGRQIHTTYAAGRADSMTVTDTADSYTWASFTDHFDLSGMRTHREMSFDDGRTLDTTLTDGVRSQTVLTDAADSHAWHSITDTFDPGGALTSRTTVFDDGSEVTAHYADEIA